MTPYLVFDLETIPDVAGLRALYEPAESLSDAEFMEQVFAERREKTGSDFLPHHLQKIAVVGCVFRDNNGFRVKTLGDESSDEASMIRQFFKIIDFYTPQIISWNGSGFDWPVLHYRSLIHGISSPCYWDTGEVNRDFKFNNYLSRYHTRHTDLMDVFAAYSGRANAPLDQLAKLCGFPGKLGMDGSQVWPAWQEGRADEVRAYCETDVVNTWLMFCRFRLIKGEIDEVGYEQEIELVKNSLASIDKPHWKEYLESWK